MSRLKERKEGGGGGGEFLGLGAPQGSSCLRLGGGSWEKILQMRGKKRRKGEDADQASSPGTSNKSPVQLPCREINTGTSTSKLRQTYSNQCRRKGRQTEREGRKANKG